MSIVVLLLMAAVILFAIAAFGVASRINLTAAGLVCLAGSMLVGVL